jgi:uncharacterized membrane protein
MWSSVFITLGMLVSVMVSAYMACRKMDPVLKIMQAVPDGKIRLPWPGIKGRIIQLGLISGIIVFPQSAIKAGIATALEIESIPIAFKKQAAIVFYINSTVFALMILWAFMMWLTE